MMSSSTSLTTTGQWTSPTFTTTDRLCESIFVDRFLLPIQVRLMMKQDPEEQIPEYDEIFRFVSFYEMEIFYGEGSLLKD